MLGFGYDCSWEKAEENTCSLGIEAGDAADGWEESCPLCAQGAWLHSEDSFQYLLWLWHGRVPEELYVVPQDYETDLMLSALCRQ